MVLVDSSFKPLRRAITWMDARGAAEKEKLLLKLSVDDIYNITGWRLQSILPLLQSIWLKKNELSAGIYKDLEQAAQVFKEEEEIVDPDPSMKGYYDEKFSSYIDTVTGKIEKSL